MGAHAALVVTPAYYGDKMTAAALEAHFTAVADASPIPVLLYDVTKFTHISLSLDTVLRLAAHGNIVGIKDSSGNVAQLGELIAAAPDEFNILVGTAGALYPALTLGCTGGIVALANVAPAQCVQIYELIQSGQLAEARRLHLQLLPVNRAVTARYGIAGLKAAMDMLGDFGGEPRRPLLPLTNDEKEVLRGILRRAELLA